MNQRNHCVTATMGLALLIGCVSESSHYPPLDAEIELERALQTARAADKAVLVHVSGPG